MSAHWTERSCLNYNMRYASPIKQQTRSEFRISVSSQLGRRGRRGAAIAAPQRAAAERCLQTGAAAGCSGEGGRNVVTSDTDVDVRRASQVGAMSPAGPEDGSVSSSSPAAGQSPPRAARGTTSPPTAKVWRCHTATSAARSYAALAVARSLFSASEPAPMT